MPRRPYAKRPGDTVPSDDGLKTVTCVRCNVECEGPTNTAPGYGWMRRYGGRIYGRPVCALCLPYARREPKPVESSFGIVQTWE